MVPTPPPAWFQVRLVRFEAQPNARARPRRRSPAEGVSLGLKKNPPAYGPDSDLHQTETDLASTVNGLYL